MFLNLLLGLWESNLGEKILDLLILRDYSVGDDGSSEEFDLRYTKVTFFDGQF